MGKKCRSILQKSYNGQLCLENGCKSVFVVNFDNKTHVNWLVN